MRIKVTNTADGPEWRDRAPGQAEYEAAVREAAAWSTAPRPSWDELALSNRAAWGEVAAMAPLGAREHCFCPATGPRVIAWADRERAWCHTDGYPCPSTAKRPAPETAGAVLL